MVACIPAVSRNIFTTLSDNRSLGSEGPDLAALGEVLDVTVASVLAARNGSGGLLGSLLELLTVLVHAAQQAANRLRQVGCSKPTTSAAIGMADNML